MFTEVVTKLFSLSPRETWAVQTVVDTWNGLFENIGTFFTKFVSSILIILEMFGMLLFDLPVTPRGQALDLTGYTLVFEDEFDGNTLDMQKWQHRAQGARRNGFNADTQVRVENGNMILSGEYHENGKYGAGWYAGMVKTVQDYKYGYFEIRCKVNPDNQFWSAFWIQAYAPYTPEISQGGIGGAEIDIFESFNYGKTFGSDGVSQTIHCSGMKGDTSGGLNSMGLGTFKGKNIYTEYNTYGLEWDENEYIFYINGVETRRSSFADGTSKVAEQVIVSLEIPAEITHDQDFRTEYVVDYVKIYQKQPNA